MNACPVLGTQVAGTVMCACQVTMATLGMGSVNPAVVTSMGQGHRSATLIQVSACLATAETMGTGSVNHTE